MKRLAIALALTWLLAAALAAPASAAEAPCELTLRAACYGLSSVSTSLSAPPTSPFPSAQAGAHPDLGLNFALKEDPESKPNPYGLREPYARTRDLITELPPGLVGDPNVLGLPEQCESQELIEYITVGCPNGSQVGLTKISLYGRNLCEPIYMMVPPGGDKVARLGFIAGVFPFFIDFKLRSAGDYGLTAEITDAPSNEPLIKAETTIWGVPSDPSHDRERIVPGGITGECESESRPPGSKPLPFMTNPTNCGPGKPITVRADSWSLPGIFSEMSTALPTITGCNELPFGPSLTATPTSGRAGAQTGLNLTVKLPASVGKDVLEPSQIRYMRIRFPAGMSFAPGAADGLEACSAEQVGYEAPFPENAHCPAAAKLGSTEFDIPVLERRMKGALYLRTPEPGSSPESGDLYRVWIVADDLGAHVKLPAQLKLDRQSGQIESIVVGTPKTEGIPQAPLREVKLFLKSGFRAPLANPSGCGTYFTHSEFTPWSGTPPVPGDSLMRISEGCDTGGFSPKLTAGTASPQAGSYSPFVFDLAREDGEQNPAFLDVTLPPGLVAKLAGIPPCEGQAAETGNCPEASRIGRVLTAVGPGPAPLWAPQLGKDPLLVYLAGPYKGAPLSIVVRAPAQAGPFDLGVIVVRSAIYVDPATAQVAVKSDTLPQIIDGIPLDYRHIIVNLDRENFNLNPTSCEPMSVGARVTSSEGAVATPSARFQAAGCRGLGFKPSLSLKLVGGTKRGAHPALTATLRAREGDANIAGAQVTLPHSEFLDQGHIKTICTRVQFAAHECPAGSIYGYAVAKTPLFDTPLEGPVYQRSSSHNLPDLVAALKGPASEPVEVDLDGRIDSVHGGIRVSYEVVPDAPVSEFTLSMQGGKKGLLVNSTNLCAKTNRATARFSAQNGKAIKLHPALKSACVKQRKKRRA